MFCPKCGTKIEETVKFCPQCGINLTDVISQHSDANQTQSSSASAPIGSTSANSMYGSMTELTLTEVKLQAKSPLTLTAVILFTLGILLSFTSNPLTGILNLLSSSLGSELGYEVYYVINQITAVLGNVGFMSNVIPNLPTILYAVGMWVVVISAFKTSKLHLATGGLTLIKVLVVISFVLSIIASGVAVIGMLILISSMGEFDGISVLLILIPIVILIVLILYFTKLIKVINNIRYTAESGTPITDISGFIIFCCYITGILSIITSLFSLSGLVNAVSLLLFGIILGKYKRKMQYIINHGRNHIVE